MYNMLGRGVLPSSKPSKLVYLTPLESDLSKRDNYSLSLTIKDLHYSSYDIHISLFSASDRIDDNHKVS
jgi:hypothetical protein